MVGESSAVDGNARLQDGLDRLALRSERVLRRWQVKNQARKITRQVLTLIYLFPLVVILVEVARFVSGAQSWNLTLWNYAVINLLFILLYISIRLLWRYFRTAFTRECSLGLFDRQLNLANRLATADEFLSYQSRSVFMEAAIEDAAKPLNSALNTDLDKPESVAMGFQPWSLLSIALAVGLTLVSVWVGAWETATDGEQRIGLLSAETVDLQQARAATEKVVTVKETARDTETAYGQDQREDLALLNNSDLQSSGSGQQTQDASAQLSRQEKTDSAGEASNGTPATSDMSSENASMESTGSRQGEEQQNQAPDTQELLEESNRLGVEQEQSSESPDAQNNENSEASAESTVDGEYADADSQSPESANSASESESGSPEQGDSSQQNDASGKPSKASSSEKTTDKSSEQNADAAEGESAGEMPDSDNESDNDAKGGSQEANRDDKGGQPSEQSNSSSSKDEAGQSPGKDALKKGRGASTAILAVPEPDRLLGKVNEGPELIKQQQSEPGEKPSLPLDSEQRLMRSGHSGELRRTKITSWSRTLVETYFKEMRAESKRATATSKANGEEKK